ncbi:hypothetical protein BgiBS90_037056, partial [Biomphalaria glabrata]
ESPVDGRSKHRKSPTSQEADESFEMKKDRKDKKRFRRDYKCIISTPVILFRNTVETYDPELSKRRKSKQNGEANGSSKMYAERDYKEKSKQQSHSTKSKEQFNETDGSPKLKMKEKRDKSYP